jgi:hypothetical protein
VTEQLQLGMGEERTGRNACATWQRWAELDALVAKALGSELLTEREREILRVIAGHKGAAHAIRSEDVAKLAGMEWCEKSRREIAGVVETAVLLLKIPIGGLRGKPCGYFLIVNANDLEQAITPLWGEVYALLRRLRALTGKQLVARMFGQAMLKLDAEVADPGLAGKPKEAA